jgi:hypothetical protein
MRAFGMFSMGNSKITLPPLVLIISCLRSVTKTKPSASILPMSHTSSRGIHETGCKRVRVAHRRMEDRAPSITEQNKGGKIMGHGIRNLSNEFTGTLIGWGVVMILLGVVALFLPLAAGTVVSILISWIIILSGCAFLASAFAGRNAGAFIWRMPIGVVYIVVVGYLPDARHSTSHIQVANSSNLAQTGMWTQSLIEKVDRA